MNGERVASYENVTHVLRAWYGGRHGALGEPGNYPFTKGQFVNAPVFPRYAFIAITSFRARLTLVGRQKAIDGMGSSRALQC